MTTNWLYLRSLILVKAICLALVLSACASQLPKYSMDNTTSAHPATQRFIAFSDQAKTAEAYDAMLAAFYTPATQAHIAKQLGWRKFLYSSAYRALKNGNCESIELKPLGNRVQIDFIGSMVVSSMFVADQQQSLHLRVYMVQQKGEWFMDKSGYVAANLAALPVTFNKAGMKFKSEFE
jgi:threonine/homoserine efflux transporter RhtA